MSVRFRQSVGRVLFSVCLPILNFSLSPFRGSLPSTVLVPPGKVREDEEAECSDSEAVDEKQNGGNGTTLRNGPLEFEPL